MIMCLGFESIGVLFSFFFFLLFSFDVWSPRWPLKADEMGDEICMRVCVGLNFYELGQRVNS